MICSWASNGSILYYTIPTPTVLCAALYEWSRISYVSFLDWISSITSRLCDKIPIETEGSTTVRMSETEVGRRDDWEFGIVRGFDYYILRSLFVWYWCYLWEWGECCLLFGKRLWSHLSHLDLKYHSLSNLLHTRSWPRDSRSTLFNSSTPVPSPECLLRFNKCVSSTSTLHVLQSTNCIIQPQPILTHFIFVLYIGFSSQGRLWHVQNG